MTILSLSGGLISMKLRKWRKRRVSLSVSPKALGVINLQAIRGFSFKKWPSNISLFATPDHTQYQQVDKKLANVVLSTVARGGFHTCRLLSPTYDDGLVAARAKKGRCLVCVCCCTIWRGALFYQVCSLERRRQTGKLTRREE